MSRMEDEERFKSLISGAKGVPWRAEHHERSRRRNYQREIGKIFESFFTKAGLDVRKLNEILVQERDEIHRNFREEVANAAKHFPSAQAIFRQDMEAWRTTLAILAEPFTSTFITLDMPSVIFEYPQWSPAIVDAHYESFNNWVKIKIDDNSGPKDHRWFGFSFPWTNESDYFAVINISSLLVLNGNCEARAHGGLFSAGSASLDLTSRLDLFRQAGWGSDPWTGDNTWAFEEQEPVANLDAWGQKGHPFGGGTDAKPKVFGFEEFDRSHDFFLVPGRAQIVVFVALDINWSTDRDINDSVSVNFADENLFVGCPFVKLELLTAPRLT
jgi:hypothetical protein